MLTVDAYRFLTSKWAPGWKQLEDSQFVAQVKLTPAKMVREGNDYDDGGTYVQYLRVPAHLPAWVLKEALRDTLSGSNCRHEYDCCGCTSRFVRVKQTSPRRLAVFTNVSYNY